MRNAYPPTSLPGKLTKSGEGVAIMNPEVKTGENREWQRG